MVIELNITHFYMGLGSGSKVFVPAWCFGDGSRGRMLLIGQVPLLFDLEHFGVVIVHGAGAVSSYPSLSDLVNERGGSRGVPGVEPCSSTIINERTFEN